MTIPQRPTWYLEPGVTAPAHLPPGLMRRAARPGYGPDVDAEHPGAQGGGMCIGGAFDVGQSGWHRHADGWWYRADPDTTPSALRRLAVISGEDVEGGSGSVWHVPRLMHFRPDGWHPAVEPVLTASGWHLPGTVADVVEGLRRYVDADDALQDPDGLVAVIVQLLALNYHISRHELIAHGWMTPTFCARCITAALARTADLPDEDLGAIRA